MIIKKRTFCSPFRIPDGIRYVCLKDGGRSLYAMVHYLKKEYGWDVDEKACKTHMNERTNGKGTKGYNDCGSL